MPLTPTPLIWMDGELVPWDDAKVHVLTHSLHYGTAVFEGIRAYSTDRGPAVFRLRDHIARLARSARLLSMELPYDEDELCEATRAVVRASGLDSGYIRPLVYYGYGEMGLNPLLSKTHASVAMWSWGAYLGDDGIANGIRLKVSSWARHDPRALPTAAKATGMYINSSLAKVEAVRAGYDEALMLTTDGYLAEGTGENLFLVKENELVMPSMSATGALSGITADAVIRVATDLGYPVREALLRRSDIYLADEAFLTGTAAEVVPIASVDDLAVGTGRPGPITKILQEHFVQIVHGGVDQYKDWLDYVE
ncbi:MAG TPA: branched-chain amino acid transaminase [Acidimicrobiales bacterium]|jgi:branched-chain amino acid aminotransferase|nr:branched-chain amino acid transaminase [Acidimicrobiales bacterium]